MGSLSGTFLFDVFSIILIDILLAGDNAVLIAMAVKSLPPPQRRIGIIAGAGGAVVLRIVLTFFAAKILQLSFLKLIGGALILWIALTSSAGDGERLNQFFQRLGNIDTMSNMFGACETISRTASPQFRVSASSPWRPSSWSNARINGW